MVTETSWRAVTAVHTEYETAIKNFQDAPSVETAKAGLAAAKKLASITSDWLIDNPDSENYWGVAEESDWLLDEIKDLEEALNIDEATLFELATKYW